MQAAILSIGDELALGQTVDTNAAWLAARLMELGIDCRIHLTVPDDQAAIAEAFNLAAARASLVIATGGLGPTADDLTRQALADAMGVELTLDEPALAVIREFFTRRQRPMNDLNKLQAYHPRGSAMLHNPAGTAPGILGRLGGAMVYVFPGVPSEMMAMYDLHIRPALAAVSGRVILTRTLHTFGGPESEVGRLMGELMDRRRNPRVGTTVARGIVSVRVRAEAAEREEAMRLMEETCGQVIERLGKLHFGADEATLPDAVGGLLHKAGLTVATAESCTGGLVAKMLTDIAGSSAWMKGGWVTYSNERKMADLGVAQEPLERFGAVSEPVAEAMARGALRRAGTDFALSLTGIAGPGGGSEAKPVGLVYIGLAERAAGGAEPRVRVERAIFPGDRGQIRDRAAKTALNMLRIRLME